MLKLKDALNRGAMDGRKRQIVEQMASAPHAELVSPQDRVIIADLVMSAVMKIMDTLDVCMEQAARVLPDNGMDAFLQLTLLEGSRTLKDAADLIVAAHIQAVVSVLGSPAELKALAELKGAGIGAELDRLLRAMNK